jgi:diketogulonate reductase-like aldo/keto reductase
MKRVEDGVGQAVTEWLNCKGLISAFKVHSNNNEDDKTHKVTTGSKKALDLLRPKGYGIAV